MSVSKAIESQPVIAYKVCYAKISGSDHTCALFLSQVAYWCSRSESGWARITHDSLEDQTGMGRKSQDRACAYWCSVGVMKKELRGIPAKINYFIDFDALDRLLLGYLVVPNGQAVVSVSDKLSIEDYKETISTDMTVMEIVKTPPLSVPPTDRQWVDYCLQKFPDWLPAKVEEAWHYNVSRGWMVGRSKMKNWQSVAATAYGKAKEWGHVIKRRHDSTPKTNTDIFGESFNG